MPSKFKGETRVETMINTWRTALINMARYQHVKDYGFDIYMLIWKANRKCPICRKYAGKQFQYHENIPNLHLIPAYRIFTHHPNCNCRLKLIKLKKIIDNLKERIERKLHDTGKGKSNLKEMITHGTI